MIALNPNNPSFYERKARLYVKWQGDEEGARGVLQEAARRIDPERILIESRLLLRIFGEEYAAALDRLSLEAVALATVKYYLAKAELNVQRSQSGLAQALSRIL